MREQVGNETGIAAGFTASLPHPGFIYFIRAGRTPNVKIGWARDPERRLDTLQTGCPHKLHLIGFAPGTPADETDWHYRWEALRARGEWFRLSNGLRYAINDRLHLPDATCFIHIKTNWREAASVPLDAGRPRLSPAPPAEVAL